MKFYSVKILMLNNPKYLKSKEGRPVSLKIYIFDKLM
jgi:hypothetical protein